MILGSRAEDATSSCATSAKAGLQASRCWVRRVPIPRPPNVPLLRALWYLLVGIWGILKGSWVVLVVRFRLLYGSLHELPAFREP